MHRTKFIARSGIYQITSKKNSKIYIGSACDLRGRKNGHLHALRKNKHHSILLQRHVNKYGIDDLLFEILEFCSKKILLKREQYYLDILLPEFNICKEAKNCMGRIVSLKTRAKISKTLTGKPSVNKGKKVWSEEQKRKISLFHTGNTYSLGYIYTEGRKQKIKDGNIKYWNSEEGKQRARDRAKKHWESPKYLKYRLNNPPNGKPILYDYKYFRSIKEASSFFKINENVIYRLLKKEIKGYRRLKIGRKYNYEIKY